MQEVLLRPYPVGLQKPQQDDLLDVEQTMAKLGNGESICEDREFLRPVADEGN